MNTEQLSGFVKCYGAYDGETIIAFMAVIHSPHPIKKNTKRVSRLVVLPDYQGCGVGYKFLNAIAEMFKQNGFHFTITTSAKNLILKLHKSDRWQMKRLSAGGHNAGNLKNRTQSERPTVKTASFEYRG